MFTNVPRSPEVATVSVMEAAHLMRVHEKTIRRWIRDGHLKAMRPNPTGRFRIAVIDLEALRDAA